MLPELIDKLRDLVDGEFAEADRAMCRRGDFQLQSMHARHNFTVDVWSNMSDGQRKWAIDAYFKIQATQPTTTSTDGSLAVSLTLGRRKKIEQQKRQRNDRTNTCAKKVKF